MKKSKVKNWVREAELARALDLVESGNNVDVVGSRGSGRTAVLGELARRLTDRGYRVMSVRGAASLQQHPLGALLLAGVNGNGNGESRGGSLWATAAAVGETLAQPDSVLLVDDWDDLDEASWGILETVRRLESVPTVLSRLQGRQSRHTPTGLAASTVVPAYVLELRPLSFDQLETIVVDTLGGPVTAPTMSRIYENSGGTAGLAIAMVEAASRDGGMSLVDGRWTARENIWSPALCGVLESYLESLPGDARDALETLALIGTADVSTARRLVDWTTIEFLEDVALVQIVACGVRRLITVMPPLLVEYFRHEPHPARRLRLTEAIQEQLGADEATMLADFDLGCAGNRTVDALSARLAREQRDTRRSVARAAWQEQCDPQSATEYLAAIMHDPDAVDEIEALLARTDLDHGDEQARAEFVVLATNWRAFVRHDPDSALAHLERLRGVLGSFEGIARAQSVVIRTYLDRVPDDFAERLRIDEGAPSPVAASLAEAQLLALTAQGRLSEARSVYSYLEALPGDMSIRARVLEIYLLIGEGRLLQAHAAALLAFDERRGLLDADGERAFAAAALLCMMVSGDHARLDEVLAAVLATGELPPLPPTSSRGLQTVAAILAMRRGHLPAAARLADHVTSPDATYGLLPGQSDGLVRAQQIALDGDHDGAADLLWQDSEELWDRGARFAAGMGFLASLDVRWSDDRFAECASRIAQLDVPLLAIQLRYVEASHARDAVALRESAIALRAAGRLGMAASALSQVAALQRMAGEGAHAGQLDDGLEGLYRLTHAGILDTSGFGTAAVTLSSREREVARLVADGLTNAEIAGRLVLSVRTVEGHMHRIMRKLGITSRRELRRYVESSSLI